MTLTDQAASINARISELMRVRTTMQGQLIEKLANILSDLDELGIPHTGEITDDVVLCVKQRYEEERANLETLVNDTDKKVSDIEKFLAENA